MKNVIFTLMLMTGLPNSLSTQTIAINKMNELKIYEAFNSSNFNELDKYIAKNAIEHAIPPGKPNGLEGTKALFKNFKSAFPDAKITVIDLVAEGDLMLIYSEFTGTNKGNFMGMPATNKWVKIKGMDFVKFDKMGKAMEHWGLDDNMSMMQQLGLAPAAQPFPEIPLDLATDSIMMYTTPAQNKMTTNKFFEYFSMGQIDRDLTLITSNFKYWYNSDPIAHGAGTYKMLGELYLKAFPQCKWIATTTLAEGDKVATVNTFTGIHSGPLMTMPASNKSVEVKGYIIDHYRNGKIAERISVNDDLSLLQQIGAIPKGN